MYDHYSDKDLKDASAWYARAAKSEPDKTTNGQGIHHELNDVLDEMDRRR